MDIAVFFDIGVVVILLISAGVSFFRGFIREVLTIFGVLGGALIAFMFGDDLKPIMRGWFGITEGKEPEKLFDAVPMTIVADISSYAAIFIIVFLLLQLASYFLSSAVKASGLGPVDRTLGVFFGIARGIVLLGVLYLPFQLILPEENKKEWFDHSKTIFFVEQSSNWLSSFMPDRKEAEDKTKDARDRLTDIDVLGDKKIAPSGASGAGDKGDSDAGGYDTQARQALDAIIDNQMKPQAPEKTTKGDFNE